LAPIIDCFTVLITYMLVSASFITLDTLDVQVAASAPPAPPSEVAPPPPTEIPTSISARIDDIGVVTFKVSGAEEATYDTPLESMDSSIAEIRGRWPAVAEINVKAEPGVQYKQIVRAVELLKKSFTKVYLGE